jgi:hypothetical protein
MFCAPGLIFGGNGCDVSRFHVLRAQTRFRMYRGRRLQFSCFALPDSLSAVPRASSFVFLFCAPGLIFDGNEGVRSLFHVLRSQTCFRWCGGRRLLFSCFVRPDSFSTVSRAWLLFSCFALPDSFFVVLGASGTVFMFCVPGLIFGGSEGVVSCFHVLRTRTPF